MKILLIIYLVIAFLSLITFLLASGQIRGILKRTYPNIRKPHYSIGERVDMVFRALLLCFCPIIHIIVLFTYILFWDKVIAKATDDIVCEWRNDCE